MAKVVDIGIDVGTSNVLIYACGKGIILREPAVVAVERDTRRPIAVGTDAHKMIGRTPANLLVMRPLRNGTMADFDLFRIMLQYFTQQVVGKHFLSRPRSVISLPTGVNDVEKRAVISTLFDTGMRKTQLLERPIAAALGIGLPFEEAYGTMVVDIGAGATDIAVLSMGQVAVASCVQLGGDRFDEAIIRYLNRKYSLVIGERTAEELKINIGSAIPLQEPVEMEVTGRYRVSNMPKSMKINSTEIYEAMREPVNQLIESIQTVLNNTPPQLANDIFEYGIYFTGGAANLNGLCEAVYNTLHIPCGVADDPQASVALGCGRVVDDPAGLKHLLADTRRLGR